MTDTGEKLKAIFIDVFDIPETTDFESLVYRGIEEWDSVAHMQLVGAIEDEFDIMLETDDVIDMSSFLVAIEIIDRYLAAE